MHWIEIEDQGMVMEERIVAIGPAESAPMRRLIAAVPEERIIILTGGNRRQSILIMDSGHLIVTAIPIPTLMQQIDYAREY